MHASQYSPPSPPPCSVYLRWHEPLLECGASEDGGPQLFGSTDSEDGSHGNGGHTLSGKKFQDDGMYIKMDRLLDGRQLSSSQRRNRLLNIGRRPQSQLACQPWQDRMNKKLRNPRRTGALYSSVSPRPVLRTVPKEYVSLTLSDGTCTCI